LLERSDVPVHKIASFEAVDLPLIEYVSKTGKPLIISTGMASIEEIREAVATAKKAGTKDIALLKCVSDYPAKPENMNLRTIPDMIKKLNCPVGLSDHSLGIAASIAAVSLGATIIEKHFTLSRKIKTPDSFFSMEPHEFRSLVENVRIVEKAMGRVFYGLSREEEKSRVFRRSLFVVEDIKKGDIFTPKNVRSIRPADGIKPKYLKMVLGKKTKKDIDKGTPLSFKLIA